MPAESALSRPTYTARSSKRAAALLMAFVLLASLFGSACSTEAAKQKRFCKDLETFTGPNGAEARFSQDDPRALAEVINELESLQKNAPEKIRPSVETVLVVFKTVEREPLVSRDSVVYNSLGELRESADALNEYARSECGLFLQRSN